MDRVIKCRDLRKEFRVRYQTEGSFFKRVISPKLFKQVDAVRSISLDVTRGEALGVIGNNGAGKSTLIKMLTGVLLPSGGEVEVLGRHPFFERKINCLNIGVVFGQRSQLRSDLPAVDTFSTLKIIYNISNSDYKKRLSSFVEMFGIEDKILRPVRTLSLGERMKCELVCAFLHNPDLVFLDEPTIGLDILSKDLIGDFLTDMRKKGITILLTTHDIEEISKICDRAVLIDRGELIMEESIESLLRKSNDLRNVSLTMRQKEADISNLMKYVKQNANEAEVSVDSNVISVRGVLNHQIPNLIESVAVSNKIENINISNVNLTEIVKEKMKGGL